MITIITIPTTVSGITDGAGMAAMDSDTSPVSVSDLDSAITTIRLVTTVSTTIIPGTVITIPTIRK